MTSSIRPSNSYLNMPGGLRKQPLQERSRIAIQRVLDTATDLVLEMGAEAVVESAALLLDKSGISRGSFYSFFETPQSVLDELALQCLQNSAADFTERLTNRDTDSWLGIVDALIDSYNAQFRIPLVRELWVRQQLTATVRALDRAWIDKVSLWVLDEFHRHTPLFDSMTVAECIVPIESLERVFQYAYRDSPNGDVEAVAAVREMVVSYWTVCAERDR